jgi:hypothetical protein
MRRRTPIGALGRGLLGGLAGTAAMTAYQKLTERIESDREGGSDGGEDPWASAPAPAQVGKRLVEGLFRTRLGSHWIPVLANAVHWAYGTAWGAAFGLVRESRRKRRILDGPAFGLAVWVASYAQLVPMGIYELPWKCPAKTLALDVSYHLVYGAGVGAAHTAIRVGAAPLSDRH